MDVIKVDVVSGEITNRDFTPEEVAELNNPTTALEPDWEQLSVRILTPDIPSGSFPKSLFPIFDRVRDASFVNGTLITVDILKKTQDTSTALSLITSAVVTVRIEGALAKGLQDLVTKAKYQFTAQEKALWKAAVDELNFSPLVYLP